jgi:PAS domain S-box-containing protein
MPNPPQKTTPLARMQLSKPSVGLAAVALVLLCALFVVDHPGRWSAHEPYRGKVSQLQVASLELEKDLLRAWVGLPERHGASADEFAAARARAGQLRDFPAFLPDEGRRRLSLVLEDYLRTLAEAEAGLARAPADAAGRTEEQVRQGVGKLLDGSLSASAERVLSAYLGEYEERLAGAERTRVLFFALALLLGGYVVVALVRLGQAGRALNTLNAELERRVEERTAALSSTNAELRDSEARKAAILEGSVDGIAALDESSRILEFSPAAERIFRLPRAQALGRDFLSLGLAASVKPEQRLLVRGALQPDVPPGRATRLELAGVRADGDVFPCELTLIRVAAEGPARFTAYVRDITDRKEVERMKSEFVSTVSHELRTPLTSIRGSLGLLEGGVVGALPGPVLEMVRIARTNTERLIRLINDILDLEKMEAGKLELRLQAVEVSEVVESTFNGVRATADAAKVELRAEAGAAGLVRADKDRLIQVLTNLVSNAIKFSPAQGVVTVRAIRDALATVRFEVVDQGPGIPREKRARLFGKFQQLDSSDTRSKGGTGLGLAISQAIIDQHGGRIEVRGEPGQGATFTFSLPVVKADSGSLSMSRDESRYNVLVVTGDTELSTLLRGLLASEGYRVLRASSAAEAGKLIEAGTPDVLVVDPQLPDGDGMALVRRLHEEPGTRELPVLMLAERPSAGGESPRVRWVGRLFDETHFLQALRYAVRVPGLARVLVVDNDEDARRLVRMRLERLGVTMLEAGDGERAVELARQAPPDLILLDVQLPRLDGFEVVDMLRQGKVRGTPLIIFTARELTPVELRQLTLGITHYIAKKTGAEGELATAAQELLNGLLAAPESRKVAS